MKKKRCVANILAARTVVAVIIAILVNAVLAVAVMGVVLIQIIAAERDNLLEKPHYIGKQIIYPNENKCTD